MSVQKFHVLVDWPQGPSWLILIEAASWQDARHIVESSDDVRDGGGRVATVTIAGDD